MVVVENMTKIYKMNHKQKKKFQMKEREKKAVDDISFTAFEGEIYGLIGTNGAGKTTTLRCIATLLSPTKGNITVCGGNTVEQPAYVRSQIGFLTTEIKLEPQFTPEYVFQFFGKLYNIKKSKLEMIKKELFEYFEITKFANKKICELSTGMKQKVSIVVSLVHDPQVIIFDEPTNGLDILMVKKVLDYLKVLRERGKTVIISTHELIQVQKLCNRVGIIIDGRMFITGTPEEICNKFKTKDLEEAFFKICEMKEGSK